MTTSLGDPADLHAAVRDRVTERSGLFGSCTGAVLWDWFASIGNAGPLPGIAEDIRRLASAG